MAPSDSKSDDEGDALLLFDEESDWDLPISFNSKRHTDPIEGIDTETQTWRMKERMKTVSVALVICLNVGVDPPDIVKTQPCARLECWIDPQTMGATRALEAIGNSLQKQYERWQPRARYKQSLDPTVDEVKKLCTSLRRNAKEERVLFHYNGHGVPRPTANGEIWVFNRLYTQYIPLSVYDLQTWMGAPSIYVYDCSNAGIIVELFKQFADQHEREYEQMKCQNGMIGPSYKKCIQLAACGADEVLPMHPDLPADVFTSCLTTPIKIALRWFVMQNSARLEPKITLDSIDKIPGQLTDRRTMLGELNWIFTAITDTIAWNTLPRELFQKLFRQDLLVASLFRNFLLAERILHSYNCCPVSSPALPATHQHPMWTAWDLALDLSLYHLPAVLHSDDNFTHSPFFQDQLTAFQVSLARPFPVYSPPTQLPIVLQVLLSQVHRLRALELLGRFLDVGPSAVNLALSVGIFPYVLKLLQSSAKELRPLLVFIWAKILAIDSTCQADLVRDNGHKYFLSILQDPSMTSKERTLATFVLACMVDEYEAGQEAALQGQLVSICLEQLSDPSPVLRQWLAICLGRLWRGYDQAKWIGVRDQAHDKLYLLLTDDVPEVRAAAVFALGTFISSAAVRSEHANSIDQGVALYLLNIVSKDMSPLVRQELVVALQTMVLTFEHSFLSVALQEMKEGNQAGLASGIFHSPVSSSRTKERTKPTQSLLDVETGRESLKRVCSSSSISSLGSCTSLPSVRVGSVYHKMWSGLTSLDSDPCPTVSAMARKITDYIREQICAWPGQSPHQEPLSSLSLSRHLSAKESVMCKDHIDGKSSSLPPSPSNRSGFLNNSPPKPLHTLSAEKMRNSQFGRPKSKNIIKTINEESGEENNNSSRMVVRTRFEEWSCRYFAEPLMTDSTDRDLDSQIYSDRQWRFKRNNDVKKEAAEELGRLSYSKLDTNIFSMRLAHQPHSLTFHPYETQVAVAYKDTFVVCDYATGYVRQGAGTRLTPRASKISCLQYINAHEGGLVAAAYSDGSVRIFDQAGLLITAWQALYSPPRVTNLSGGVFTGGGMVMAWDQVRTELLVGGEPRVLRIWDATKELCTREIPTGTDQPLTSIHIDPTGGRLVAVGCGDGSVRLFDRRLSPSDARVMTYRDNSSRVVTVSLHHSTTMLLSGSAGGDVRLYDTRSSQSSLVLQSPLGIKAMAAHSTAGIFAWPSSNQISIHEWSKGELINPIKFGGNDWFNKPRFGPVSCLSFHQHRLLLGVGSEENSISLYSIDLKR